MKKIFLSMMVLLMTAACAKSTEEKVSDANRDIERVNELYTSLFYSYDIDVSSDYKTSVYDLEDMDELSASEKMEAIDLLEELIDKGRNVLRTANEPGVIFTESYKMNQFVDNAVIYLSRLQTEIGYKVQSAI
ncbi:MAG: hypothetical protein AB8E15_11335 [Bdellovibrionales bacterium]